MIRSLKDTERKRAALMLPMVKQIARNIAKRYPTIPRDELEAIGNEFIVVALSRHDPTLGELEGYVYALAQTGMMNHIRKTLLTSARERPVLAALIQGESLDERSPVEKFEDALQSTVEMDREEIVLEMRTRVAGCLATLCTDQPEDDSEEALLAWREMAHGRRILEETVATLGEPDRTVYRRFYREERTLDDIAKELGVSKRSVQRIGDRVRATIDQAVRNAPGV